MKNDKIFKVIFAILFFVSIIPVVNANIICNDGTRSNSCTDCHQGCCSRHGGCTATAEDNSSDSNIYVFTEPTTRTTKTTTTTTTTTTRTTITTTTTTTIKTSTPTKIVTSTSKSSNSQSEYNSDDSSSDGVVEGLIVAAGVGAVTYGLVKKRK